MSTDPVIGELVSFAAHLATRKPLQAVKPTLAKTATDIKKRANQDFADSKHFKGAAGSVSYEWVSATGHVLDVEIGVEHGKGKPGDLATVAYHGSSRGGGGTVPDIGIAAGEEWDKAEAFIASAIADLFDGGGR